MRIKVHNSRKYISHVQEINHILLKTFTGMCTILHGISGTLCTVVHIGSKIKEVHKASGLSVTAFAKKIHTSRRNVYIIFGKPTIDTGQLVRIASVLGHDFFRYYTTGSLAETPGELPTEQDRLTRLEKEMAGLKEAVELLGC